MALPNNPPISLSQVRAEFSAPANAPLSAFLRGGAYVPNTPVNAGVPAGLPIRLTDLLGASASTTPGLSASASPASVSGTAQVGQPITTTAATASYSGGSGSVSYQWQRVSGTGTINNPNSASTTFSAPGQWVPGTVTGTFRCLVTRGSESAYTNQVSASFNAAEDPLYAEINPFSVSADGPHGGSLTTNAATVSVTGGSGAITYAWERVSGTATINSPSSATTTLTMASPANPGDYQTQVRCKVTRGGQTTYTSVIYAYFSFIAAEDPLYAEISPSSVSAAGAHGGSLTTNAATVNVTGGSGAITYAWERVSGTATINSPSSATTTLTMASPANPGDYQTQVRCKVTRGGQTTYTSAIYAYFSFSAVLSATASPSNVVGFTAMNGGTATSGASTVSVTGGSGAISYEWERVSGDALVSIRSPAAASTQFQAQVGTGATSRSATFRCKVTRGGVTAYTNTVTAHLEYLSDAAP